MCEHVKINILETSVDKHIPLTLHYNVDCICFAVLGATTESGLDFTSSADLDDFMTTADPDSDTEDEMWGPNDVAVHGCCSSILLTVMSAVLVFVIHS